MQSILAGVHGTLSNMIALYSLLVGIWGVINFLRRQPPDGNYNGALVIGVALFILQGLLGVILVLTGAQPAQGLHFLYGVTIVLTIPAIFAFTRGSNTVRDSFLYGAGMIFIWGLAQRAVETAG